MRVCIDVSQAAYEGTGSARYVVELVRKLLQIDSTNIYTLFGSASGKRDALKRLRSVLQVNEKQFPIFPFPPRFFEVLWNSLHIFPIENFVGQLDIYHSSDWTQAPSRAKKITTVHDLIPFLFPEYVHPRIRAAHEARWRWIEKEVDAIIVDSADTKKDILEKFSITDEKIHVIPLACDDRFFAVGERRLQESDQVTWGELDLVMRRYSLNREGYVLAVGTLEPRKNMHRLVEAYQQLSSEMQAKYPLVIVGKQAWAADLPKSPHIHLPGYVNDEELPYLYGGARCFIMPSLYEGFGLPVLEAMASGAAVICSERSSFPEIGGDDVHYIQDPEDVSNIRMNLAHLLESSDQEILQGRKSSFERAKTFSWERTARETLEVYKKL